jgi:hypothetical protein
MVSSSKQMFCNFKSLWMISCGGMVSRRNAAKPCQSKLGHADAGQDGKLPSGQHSCHTPCILLLATTTHVSCSLHKVLPAPC